MNTKNDEISIDLWKLIQTCFHRWKLIALVTVLFGLAAMFVSVRFITPTYKSTVKIYVNNSSLDVSSLSISVTDMNASVQLVDLYEVLLMADDTLDIILEAAGLDYSYGQIIGMLETSSVNDTQVFQVIVTSTSPVEAQLIAATIGEKLPEVINDLISGADAVVISHPKVPTARSAPSHSRNTVLGALVGFVIAVAGITVAFLMDTGIYDDEDILEVTASPILAYLPDMSDDSRTKRQYKQGYYYQQKGKEGTR